jgi:small subunit ribosomal protein S6
MVLHPEMPEAQIRETIDRAKRLIEESSGKVHEMQEWGIRELAYPIRKLHRGYYVLAEYDANADVVREFERTLKIADEVLRFVSVATVTTTPKTKPSKARRAAERPAETATASE